MVSGMRGGARPQVDDAIRFGDAIAAALKVLVNMAGQGWCEHYIVKANSATKPSSHRVVEQHLDGTATIGKPCKLSADDAADPIKVGAKVLLALAWREDGRDALVSGGVKERFDDKHHKALRYAKELVGASGDLWKAAVRTLVAHDVLSEAASGNWKLTSHERCSNFFGLACIDMAALDGCW